MGTESKTRRLGIDVGSVTAKLALIDGDNRLVASSYCKHFSRPLQTLQSSLTEILKQVGPGEKLAVAVTGSGRVLVSEVLGVPAVNEIVAQAVGISHACPGARTVIEIGGQDSKFIRLGPAHGAGDPLILSQSMNEICAAGTGAFVEQQAERMNIPIEDFGKLALQSTNPAQVAGRCAVFAKTDIIHLQQEGVPKQDIAAGICRAVVRNYLAQFLKGRSIEKPVVFSGGLAANAGVVKAFREVLKVTETELAVPGHFKVMGAFGTAMMASRVGAVEQAATVEELLARIAAHQAGKDAEAAKESSKLAVLKKSVRRVGSIESIKTAGSGKVYVGIDVGSTSTCIAVLDSENRLLAENYTLNRGSLVDSVRLALAATARGLGERRKSITVSGVGVTGSGRQLVGRYVGADVIRDEISAQATAAAHMMPDADTVFEIGGQDSKYIRLSGGRVVDFEMNKVCAAGTGSFLQEQADRLREDVKCLSGLAVGSKRPVDLGSRCTVFMESDVVNHQYMGATKEDLAAGLSYSIARNYLEKVVAGKKVGDKIVMLGGVAFNDSVVAAFQEILGKEVIVPEHHETSGAIGIALIARDAVAKEAISKSKFLGFDRQSESCEVASFTCTDCKNACRVNRVKAGVQVFNYGGACGKHEGDSRKQKKRVGVNLFAEREMLLMSYLRQPAAVGATRIGIPRAHLFCELFPMYATFLQELGYEVVVSDPTGRGTVEAGLQRTAIDNCFACKVVYGHMANVAAKGVDKVFFPSVIEFERRVKDMERNYSCPHVQAMPSVVEGAFPDVKMVMPIFDRIKSDTDWHEELARIGKELGKEPQDVRRAVEKAREALADFRKRRENIGRPYLEGKPEQPVVVVLGKVYNVCDPGLNLNIVERLLDLGVLPIPYDCLPLSEQGLPKNYIDMVWEPGQDVVRAAGIVVEHEDFYPLFITNFGCGPDSFVSKYLAEIFRDKSFLTLDVDEHASDVGTLTRVEAFLNNIRNGKAADFLEISRRFDPFMPTGTVKNLDKLLYMPIGFDSYYAIAAAFESIGVRVKFLPQHDEETERLGRMHSSGSECLPCIMHVGDIVRMTQDPEFHPDRAAMYVPASDLACRVSLFPTSMKLVLSELGFPNVPVIAPRISMDKDEMMRVCGIKFAKNLFRGMLAIEHLSRVLSEVRPYEKEKGQTDRVYDQSLKSICGALGHGGDFYGTLRQIISNFDNIQVDRSNPRPVIGLVGDDYTRGNSFANNKFIKEIESYGGEVWTMPIWSSFLEFQMGMKPRRMWKRGKYGEFASDMAKAAIGRIDIRKISRVFQGRIKCFPDPDLDEMIALTAGYLDPRSEPLTIVALSHIIRLLNTGVDGIANLVGFQCMIHSIVHAKMRGVLEAHGHVPVMTLLFDFQEKGHQKNRIEAFMYQVKQFKERKAAVSA